MTTPRWTSPLVPALLATLLLACSGAKPAERPASAAAPAAVHPEVDADLEGCAACHAEVTPAIVADWSKGRHGMALVKCFVCHGSTGADFRARPQPSGCRGCHPAQVASVTTGTAVRNCFGCHPPHVLHASGKTSPHGATP